MQATGVSFAVEILPWVEVDSVAEILSQFFVLHLILFFLVTAILISYALLVTRPTPFFLLLSLLLNHHQRLLSGQY